MNRPYGLYKIFRIPCRGGVPSPPASKGAMSYKRVAGDVDPYRYAEILCNIVGRGLAPAANKGEMSYKRVVVGASDLGRMSPYRVCGNLKPYRRGGYHPPVILHSALKKHP